MTGQRDALDFKRNHSRASWRKHVLIPELGSRVSQATRSASAKRRRLADLERELVQLQDNEASELRLIESELACGERKRQLASESQMTKSKSTELSNIQPRFRFRIVVSCALG